MNYTEILQCWLDQKKKKDYNPFNALKNHSSWKSYIQMREEEKERFPIDDEQQDHPCTD